jgi:hypothetical protein
MQKMWHSSEAETHTAKADALDFVIESMQDVEELLETHDQMKHHRQAVHNLSVQRDKHRQEAEKLSKPLVAVSGTDG